MRLIRFGTVTLPDNGNDNLPVEYRRNLVALQNGSYDFDGNRSVVNPVSLTRDLQIFDTTQDIQTTLRDITRQANRGRAILRGRETDNTDYLTFGKVSRINYNPNSDDYGIKQTLGIAFTQDYPFWMHSADVETFLDDGEVLDDYAWNLDGGNFDTVTILGSGAATTSDTITIDNTGTAPVYRGYFVLRFENGYDMNSVKITNITNGMQLTYAVDVSGVGDIGDWVFSWLDKTILTNDSDMDRTGLTMPNNQTDWFRLEVGENVIQVDLNHAGDTDMVLDIFWTRHYTY